MLQALLLQHGLEGVEGFGDRAQALAEGVEALRHDHEFLEINRGIRVRAAVDDVGHRHRQHLGVRSAEVLEERQAQRVGGGLGVGQRDGQDGVGAELGLGFRAVELEHDAVNRQLVERVQAPERRQDLLR